MKLRWLIPIAFLLPLRAFGLDGIDSGQIVSVTIQPGVITTLHLRPEFESVIHLPEEVTSIVVGSPGTFKAEHSEGEPDYVYIKPIVRTPAQSDLLIATKSGQHVVLELVSDGEGGKTLTPVDFLIEYHARRGFLILSSTTSDQPATGAPIAHSPSSYPPTSQSAIDEELAVQKLINAPTWTRWPDQQIQTSIGDIRQWGNQTVISYSIFNASDKPVEIVAPQIQITGQRAGKKKKKKDRKGILSDQLEIRDYRLSATRLEPGARADGVVLFDRPSFKESTEKLFLQIAQADQIDRPVLIRVPFTPPIAASTHLKGDPYAAQSQR